MIGIMGGTFNPVHNGHLLLCEKIREEFELDKILFMPAKNPPHKLDLSIICSEHRMMMTKIATRSNPFFEVSDIEMKRTGASYTVDTLSGLKELYGPETQFALIIGADSMVQFHSWKDYRIIQSMAALLVAKRPETDSRELDQCIKDRLEEGGRIYLAKAEAMDYSSTEIRDRVARGQSIRYQVPEEVESYIYSNNLYRVGP